MNNVQELYDALDVIRSMDAELEEKYIEDGGEVTVESETLQTQLDSFKIIVSNEGIDMLGRWLASKEDLKARMKREKDHLQRQMNAIDKSIEYIKHMASTVMMLTDQDKVKGLNGYSFTRSVSTSTTVLKDILKENYQSEVERVLREAQVIPNDVTVTLGASVKMLPEGAELPEYYSQVSTDSVRFTKPRASKEDTI